MELDQRSDGPDWIWLAKWVTHVVDRTLVTRPIRDFSDGLWGNSGQRCWQYAGNLAADKRCLVGEIEVDINVADSDCLARGSGGMALRAQPVRKEDEMVIMITAQAKAPRAIAIIDWHCSVTQYDETSSTFSD